MRVPCLRPLACVQRGGARRTLPPTGIPAMDRDDTGTHRIRARDWRRGPGVHGAVGRSSARRSGDPGGDRGGDCPHVGDDGRDEPVPSVDGSAGRGRGGRRNYRRDDGRDSGWFHRNDWRDRQPFPRPDRVGDVTGGCGRGRRVAGARDRRGHPFLPLDRPNAEAVVQVGSGEGGTKRMRVAHQFGHGTRTDTSTAKRSFSTATSPWPH